MAPLPEVPYVAVFCGSRSGAGDDYSALAAEVGRAIAAEGAGLVYGGGGIGLMGTLADAALSAGAPVYGVIPEALSRRELAHTGLTRLEVVATMHERKARMAAAACGFLVLPGGYGTLDELFEVLTWKQLGLHDRPIVLLDAFGFFDPLVLTMVRIVEEGFAPETAYYDVERTAEAAVRRALSAGPRRPPHG